MSNSDTFFRQKRKFPDIDTDLSIKKKSAHILPSEATRGHYGKARMSCTKVLLFCF